MYNVPYFKASDQQEVMAFIRSNPFAILCAAGSDGFPVATHVPVLAEERGSQLYLLGHVMKKQDHTEAFRKNNEVLAVFHGPSTYVSASWYTDQQVASTWNYQAVHAKGRLHFLDDEGLRKLLVRLTDTFERNPGSPALVQRMDSGYLEKMMAAIVAFEVEVVDIAHVFKLSQNRDAESYRNIISELRSQGGAAADIAAEMTKREHSLFSRPEGGP